MIRLISIIIGLFFLYVCFISLSIYDSNVELIILGYKIKSSLSAFVLFCLLLCLLISITLKILFLVLNTPNIIRKQFKEHQKEKKLQTSIKAYEQLIMGNKSTSLNLIKKTINNSIDDNTNKLITFTQSDDFNEKITNLKKLLEHQEYICFASKELAKMHYSNSYYYDAEEYAIQAFNENDQDTETIEILIKIYAKMALWNKLLVITNKLQKTNIKLFKALSTNIAEYYYIAAKNYLANGDDKEAEKFIQLSLEIKTDYTEALVLYSEIKASSNNTVEVLRVLKAAYSIKPSFQIAELYIKTSSSSPEVIYGTLASIANPSYYYDLYLAIAAYLGLGKQINDLKNQKNIVQNGFT
mgnify:CR=1 FL=1